MPPTFRPVAMMQRHNEFWIKAQWRQLISKDLDHESMRLMRNCREVLQALSKISHHNIDFFLFQIQCGPLPSLSNTGEVPLILEAVGIAWTYGLPKTACVINSPQVIHLLNILDVGLTSFVTVLCYFRIKQSHIPFDLLELHGSKTSQKERVQIAPSQLRWIKEKSPNKINSLET